MIRRNLTVPVALALVLNVTAASGQQTLDERIRRASEAQLAREAAERAKTLDSQRAPAQAPAGMPAVVIDVDPAKVGSLPKAAPPPRENLELAQIKGFLDVPNGLEAIIAINGRRHAVSMAHRALSEGWELTGLNADHAEISRGKTTRVLRIAPAPGPVVAPMPGEGRTP